MAGTQWREPSGHFTQLPLSPSWAPATVQPDDVELKQRLLDYKEQVSVVDEATLYVRAWTGVKLSALSGLFVSFTDLADDYRLHVLKSTQ